MKHVLFAVCAFAFLALTGCQLLTDDGEENSDSPSSPSSPSSPGGLTYAEECWGEWLRMDRDETWYISGGSIKINNNVSSKSVSLSKQSDRVIQVTEGGHEYYLYASRIANASFTGKVVAFEDASQSVQRSVAGGKGWIKVVVDDLDNGSTTTAQTDGEGNFEVEDAIPGDEYRITPEGGTPVTVTPKGDGDDIGVITITDGVNFKTRGPQEALSPNKDHNITLEIANVGTEDCTAATYHLRFEDGLISSTAAEDALGTIEPGKTKKVAVTLRYIPSGEQYASKKIWLFRLNGGRVHV